MEEKLRVMICNKINSWEWVKKIKSSKWYQTLSKWCQKLIKGIKKNKEIIFITLGIVVATIVIGKMMDIPKASFIGGDEDAWLGYWGSIVGIMGAYFVLKIQLKSDNKKYKSETVDNTFFNLLSLHNDVLKENEDNIEKIQSNMKEVYRVLEEKTKNESINTYFINQYPKFSKKVEQIPSEFDFKEMIVEGKMPINLTRIRKDYFGENNIKAYLKGSSLSEFRVWETLYQNIYVYISKENSNDYNKNVNALKFTDKECKQIQKIKNDYYEYLEKVEEVTDEKDREKMFNNKIDSEYEAFTNGIEEKLEEYTKDIYNLSNVSEIEIKAVDIDKAINNMYKEHLVKIGYYFRLFHRIIKFLNESYKDKHITEKQLRNYIGILRAMIDENTMSLLYYNATYLEKGENMKRELQKNTFFGDKSDFNDEERIHAFLSSETLLFDSDYDKIKELTKAFN